MTTGEDTSDRIEEGEKRSVRGCGTTTYVYTRFLSTMQITEDQESILKKIKKTRRMFKRSNAHAS